MQILQAGVGAGVHARAEVDEPAGPHHQGGQHIGRKDIHGPQLGQAVGGLHPARFAEAEGDVVDHRIEAPLPIRLTGDIAHGGQGRQIADQHRPRLRQGGLGVRGARRAAGVQHHPMPLLGQQAADHQAEAVRRAGDQNLRHIVLHSRRET